MKILIVDDETPIREWIQFSIERGKNPAFDIVAVAENGNDALELALKHQVDVVITDIKMPGIDGIELMKRVLEVMPYTNFIILTNYAEFSYAREAITYGAKKYFLKSELRGKEILEALEELEEKKQKYLERIGMDQYTNGYLDIFDCYYNISNKEFVFDFWKRHQFYSENPFIVIALEVRDAEKQRELMESFSQKTSAHGLKPAMKNKNIYYILQAEQEEEILRAVEEFSVLYKPADQGLMVVGRVERGMERIMDAIEEAEKMLRYTFLFQEGCLGIQDVEQLEHLDRNEIKNRCNKILNGLFYENAEVIQNDMDEWFANFRNVSFEDIPWVRELCINLVMKMEEVCEKHFPGFREEHPLEETDWTLNLCREMCSNLLQKIYFGDNFQYSQTIREAIRYIHENYAREISLNEVAQYIYRSPEYFSRLFKTETGTTFSSYLMKYRLEKAKDLLLNTDMKVYEIAYAVGYTTPSYFSKMYRKYMGVLPEATRSQKNSIK